MLMDNAINRTIWPEAALRPASTSPVNTSTAPVSQRGFWRRPLMMTLLCALAGVAALQLWRPLYHLTDDNLDGWLPVFVEFSRRLWSGQNPFVSESLFGGGYNYFADTGVLGMVSPLFLLATPLGCSRWYYLAADLIASLNLIAIALAFCWSAMRLRERLRLEVTDATLVFLSVSYAFSGFNLLVNASWIGFVNPQASMPLMIAAFYEPGRRRSIALIVGAMLFGLLGSHPHPFVYMCGFIGLLCLFVAWHQRSWEPVRRLCAGAAIAAIILSPVLAPAMMGFSTSQRQAALTMKDATASSIPAAQLAASIVLGPPALPLFPAMSVHYAEPSFSIAIAFSLANVPLLLALARKRRLSRIEIGLAVASLIAVLLIVRPVWLQSVMLEIPLLRSLRWPFREVADLNFFLHLLALLNLGPLLHRVTRVGVIAGAASFLVIGLGAAPTFQLMHVDRALVVSGKAEVFWRALRERLGEKPRVIVGSHPALTMGTQLRFAPFSLLGAYNYAALFDFVNVSGYAPTQAGPAITKEARPFHFGGIYWYPQAEKIWRENPELTLVELLRNSPAILRVRRRGQTWVFSYDERSGDLREIERPPALPETPADPGTGS